MITSKAQTTIPQAVRAALGFTVTVYGVQCILFSGLRVYGDSAFYFQG